MLERSLPIEFRIFPRMAPTNIPNKRYIVYYKIYKDADCRLNRGLYFHIMARHHAAILGC